MENSIKRVTIEVPDNWIVVVIPNGIKIYVSWNEKKDTPARWKLNSGVKQIIEGKDYYIFVGYSDSMYVCKKDAYGIATYYASEELDYMIKKTSGKVFPIKKEGLLTVLNNHTIKFKENESE